MRDFVETAERILALVPDTQPELMVRIQAAITSDNYRAPEMSQYSWLELQDAFQRHFEHRDSEEADDADWEREICAIMRGEK